MPFEPGHKLSNGRPKGSVNKAPDKDKLIDLLNRTTESLLDSFESLVLRDKIALISAFKSMYQIEIPLDIFRPVNIINLGNGINPNADD